MSIVKRATLWLAIRRDFLLRKLSDIVFDFKLKRAVKKYGGGENIPPEVIGKLMGEGEDPMLVLIIRANRVCERLKLELANTRFFDRLRWILGEEVPSIEDRIYGLGLMDEVSSRDGGTNLYSVVLRELISNDDIGWHQIRMRFADDDSYEDFRKMCGM